MHCDEVNLYATSRTRNQGEEKNFYKPSFFDATDYPWLSLLLQEYEAYSGRTWRELKERFWRPLPFAVSPQKLKLAHKVLEPLVKSRSRTNVSAPELRMQVFTEAARLNHRNISKNWRMKALRQAGGRDSMDEMEVEKNLFSDLADQKIIKKTELTAQDLAIRINLNLVKAALMSVSEVILEIQGESLRIIRHAKLKGLICFALKNEKQGCKIQISGPLAIFHKTRIYGNALGQLLPFLAWSNFFRLEAKQETLEGIKTLLVESGDPIRPSLKPPKMASKLEDRFRRDFIKQSVDWDLIHEPQPLQAGQSMIFPDFLIQHRTDSSLYWYLEIVGFWTHEYLTKKWQLLKLAGYKNMIICVDHKLQCSNGDIPVGAKIIKFSGKIDPKVVLRLIGTPT